MLAHQAPGIERARGSEASSSTSSLPTISPLSPSSPAVEYNLGGGAAAAHHWWERFKWTDEEINHVLWSEKRTLGCPINPQR